MVKIVDHGTWIPREEDEGCHPAGAEPLWNESVYLDFTADDGSVAGYVRLGLYPNWNRAWYWACLVGRDRPTVLLADDHAPLPGPDLTVRGEGHRAAYRATHEVTVPMRSFRLTLDAAAVPVVDDPARAYDDPGGAETTLLGFDLEWTTVGGVYPYGFLPRYEIPCEVAGTIRAGGEEIAFSGHGERDHSWGERDWWQTSWLWSSGRLDDGTFFHGMRANAGVELPWPCFTVPPGGEVGHRAGFTASSVFGADGLPAGSRLLVPGLAMSAVPVAFAPVAMTSPDGRTARFPRALCRFETEDGRSGHGWTEWHQPPGWRGHAWG
ncbi:hypothetical protein FHS43_004723 [Streptosporangium becharense]|uniref:DUF7064 domain-containing protein n=1 Tax=Streptosporangium becharense TaxID=1816182 RepID=A0A7W9IJC4_9ACTN|nr:hypothetical protein [Streptosporangium becharense]MBB2913419.1 hypothetical protein [Streptosporangium becharense]MBB5821109.1 hypothetical protein [Streptosporangium becharense]